MPLRGPPPAVTTRHSYHSSLMPLPKPPPAALRTGCSPRPDVHRPALPPHQSTPFCADTGSRSRAADSESQECGVSERGAASLRTGKVWRAGPAALPTRWSGAGGSPALLILSRGRSCVGSGVRSSAVLNRRRSGARLKSIRADWHCQEKSGPGERAAARIPLAAEDRGRTSSSTLPETLPYILKHILRHGASSFPFPPTISHQFPPPARPRTHLPARVPTLSTRRLLPPVRRVPVLARNVLSQAGANRPLPPLQPQHPSLSALSPTRPLIHAAWHGICLLSHV